MTERAFPCQFNSGVFSEGMSLRDYLASRALQGLVTNGELPMDKGQVALVAYEYADAMIKIRSEWQKVKFEAQEEK